MTILFLHVFFIITTWPLSFFFFFNDTATTEIYTLSLHDALPIYETVTGMAGTSSGFIWVAGWTTSHDFPVTKDARSEEHTSELQSRLHLVCRLLLEKKKKHSLLLSLYTTP